MCRRESLPSVLNKLRKSLEDFPTLEALLLRRRFKLADVARVTSPVA